MAAAMYLIWDYQLAIPFLDGLLGARYLGVDYSKFNFMSQNVFLDDIR